MTNSTDDEEFPDLSFNGSGYGLAWRNTRGADRAIYFKRLNLDGSPLTSDTLITPAADAANMVSLAWREYEYGIAWTDYRTGFGDVYFRLLNPDGIGIGSVQRISQIYSVDECFFSSLAAGEKGFGVSWTLTSPNSTRFASIGVSESEQPSCPQNPREQTRSPTSVTLNWGASLDTDNDIARYIVFRDWVEIASTTATSWTDSSFDPAAGYVYDIVALDAAGNATLSCSSIDTTDNVPPTCPGVVMALLVEDSWVTIGWTPAQDDLSGIKEYKIYRDTSWLDSEDEFNFWDDTGVGPDETHPYYVEPIDWAGNAAVNCDIVWVSTSPIELKMSKNNDGVHANLEWNHVGLAEYRVYRSTSPQWSTELKRAPLNETTDPVLTDSVKIWYYYIQQRGL